MGFYQRYEDTRIATKRALSTEIDPRPGRVSRFPPGIEPAALTTPEDSGTNIQSDAFAALQSGTTDIAALSSATKTYASRFEAEPERSVGERSGDIGPAQMARFNPGPLLPPDGLGEEAPNEDEDCPEHSTPMLLSSLGDVPPSAVSSHCGETEGAEDERAREPTLRSAPPPPSVKPEPAPSPSPTPSESSPSPTPAEPALSPEPAEEAAPTDEGGVPENDDALDPRTKSGSAETGTVLEGVAQCGKDIIIDLAALASELLGLAKGGVAAAWEKWGPGWWTDDDAPEQFARQVDEIRNALEQNAREGMELLAALHTYFADTLNGDSVFSAITWAIKKFYTDEEWADMAVRGRERAERIVATYREMWETNRDYAIGYLACTIGSMLLGGGLLKAIRAIRKGLPGDAPDGDRRDGDGDEEGGGERPNPTNPETLEGDSGSDGAPTPNGPPKPPDERVSPEYLHPDDPDAVPLYGGPENGGVPQHGRAGSYEDLDPESRDGVSLTPDLQAEIDSATDLRDAGYNVQMLPDRPSSASPYREGDYGFIEGNESRKRPDYRINGVIFDHINPETPNSMKNNIQRKIGDGQSRNFIVRVPGDQGVQPFLNRLRTQRWNGYTEPRLNQVIIIDERSGRIVTWRNSRFDPSATHVPAE